jgi:uncharacterized RDD family membrane protein YckC
MDESNQPQELIQPEDVTQIAPVVPPPDVPPLPPAPPAAAPLAASPPPPPPVATAPAWPPPPAAMPPAPVGPAPGVQFAGHGARLGAYILDAILVGFVTTALLIVMMVVFFGSLEWSIDANGDVTVGDTSAAVGAIGLFLLGSLVITIFALLYFPFFWARGGATPGMKVAGIRVVNDRDGSRIGWGAALLRLVGFWVSGAVFYLGFIWILIDSRRRGWHDLLAGTCVISTR